MAFDEPPVWYLGSVIEYDCFREKSFFVAYDDPEQKDRWHDLEDDETNGFIQWESGWSLAACKELMEWRSGKRRRVQQFDLQTGTSTWISTTSQERVVQPSIVTLTQQAGRLAQVKQEMHDAHEDMEEAQDLNRPLLLQNDFLQAKIDRLMVVMEERNLSDRLRKAQAIREQTYAAWKRERDSEAAAAAAAAAAATAHATASPAPAEVLAAAEPAASIVTVNVTEATAPAASEDDAPPAVILDPPPEGFMAARLFHLNTLITENKSDNVGFIPFLTQGGASPYFGSLLDAADLPKLIASRDSYDETIAIIRATGLYTDKGPSSPTKQLALWLSSVRPGSYIVMRHSTQNDHSRIPSDIKGDPARSIYVIGEVTAASHIGSEATMAIGSRVSQAMATIGFGAYSPYYDGDLASHEVAVRWFRLGYTDDWTDETRSYMKGRIASTFSELCKMGDAKSVRIRQDIWASAPLEFSTADYSDSQLTLQPLSGSSCPVESGLRRTRGSNFQGMGR